MHNKNQTLSFVFGLLCLLPGLSSAQWQGNFAAGVVATGGNAESRSFNFEYGLSYSPAASAWVYRSKGKLSQSVSQLDVDVDGVSEQQSQTTTENYRSDLRVERSVSKQNYLYAQVDFYKDLFATVRRSTSETIGYGRRVIAREDRQLDLELGLGARQQLSQERVDSREFVGQTKLLFRQVFGERSAFEQQVAIQSGADNTATEANTRLKLAIVGALWAQLGFDLRHNSTTAAGLKSTDTTSSVSLLWEFGQD